MSDLGGDPACWAHLFDEGDDDSGIDGLPDGALTVDLGAARVGGGGVIWSLPHGGDLDANLVRLDPDGAIGEHVNNDVDVLMFVQSGAGQVYIGETRRDVASDHLVLIPRGARRSITAGSSGITYLSVHRRRSPLGIGRSGTKHSTEEPELQPRVRESGQQ
ncbi:MAG: hypothetical protein R2707_13095 [Acidimicrobiales bacterium]